MRLSVSTKIFLGFAVVIVAFGSAFAYAIHRMSVSRASVTVVLREIVPAQSELRQISRRLRAPEEFLALKRPSDAAWLQRLLPTVKPFARLRSVEERLRSLVQGGQLASEDRDAVVGVVASLAAFRRGDELARAVSSEGLTGLEPDAARASAADQDRAVALFDHLTRRVVRAANEGRLEAHAPELRAVVRALRRINRAVVNAQRGLALPLRRLNERAAADEKAATLAVLIIATGALVLSLLMLVMSQLTLAPIRRLREGARRVAAGHYDEHVRVRSEDEIGQLAAEFNRMADALRERDQALERQREELLRADRLATIGRLAAQITHEVRNPLASIGLNAELLEETFEEGDTEEARALLASISHEVERLKAITEEYLRFARMPKPAPTEVDVGALVEQTCGFLAGELARAEVELYLDGVAPTAGGGPPPIEADPDQLRQVVLNLARNAVEALEEVAPPRVLSVRLTEAAEGGVVLRVADNGPGLDPSLRDRLFEPFVTGKPHGTGLGLALAAQIVTEHGGTLRAEDNEEAPRGATFVVALGRAVSEGSRG